MDKSIHSTEYGVFLRVFREARRRAGLTQTDLAHKVGESQSFISKCERGERRIDVVELRAFCRAFDLTLKQFVASFERAAERRR
jgi:ribosome-binding protein aMBF1 (putative translation factor)